MFVWACEPTNEIIDQNFNGGLGLSQDTIRFDTLFTSRGSTTKRLYIRNEHNKALKISNMSLGTGVNSPYSMIVNGTYGKNFQDVEILGNDSLMVLVEVLIDPMDQDLPFLVRDSIVLQTNQKQQDVKLISWGQDANFLGDSILACNSIWEGTRPYVLYKSILVDSLCTLEIREGVSVYCAPNVNIYVKGSVKMKGTAADRIVIRNDRLEPYYENAFGQWGGVYLLTGSKDNRMEFVTLRNGQIGVRVGTPDNDTIPDLIMKNAIIENMSQSGMLCFTSDVYLDNTLIDNCRELVIGNLAGGNYTYINCTFANYSFDFIRESPVSYFSDFVLLDNGEVLKEDINLAMANTIIYGDLENEVELDFTGETRAELLLANNLFKTTNTDLDINDNILNQDPEFKSPFNYDFHLDTLSPAKDNGLDLDLTIDLDSATRDNLPDIGAYEYKIE